MRPPEKIKHLFIKQWLKKADGDLKVAKTLFAGKAKFNDIICFHAQQAVEKYLKAYLTAKQTEFPKTHKIEDLPDLVAVTNPGLAALLNSTSNLSIYAVEFRYPGDYPKPKRKETRRAIELAEETRQRIVPELVKLKAGVV